MIHEQGCFITPNTLARYCRVCEAIRSTHAAALDAAREAVAALEPMLDVNKHNGGYDCCGCSTPAMLLDDAVAAIDSLREKT